MVWGVLNINDDKDNEIADIVPHWTIVCDFADKLQIEECRKYWNKHKQYII